MVSASRCINLPKRFFYNKDCLAFLEDTMSLPYMDRQEKELERLRLLIADQDVILANLDYECDQITMSASYKIGHALLRPFWLLKRLFRSIGDGKAYCSASMRPPGFR